MKISKFYIAFFVLLTAIMVACSEYEDTVEPSPTVSADNAAVRFVAANQTIFELEVTDLSFDIDLIRDNPSAALEVPLTVTDTGGVFTVPSSVSFPAGVDTVTITITMDETAPKGETFGLEITVDESFVNIYKSEFGTYFGEAAILNWVKFSDGTYESGFFEASWPQELYRAEGTNKYRFFDLFADGYSLTFVWAGGKQLVPVTGKDADGYYLWVTGFVDPTYGMVTMHIDASSDWTYYNEGTNSFTINAKWTVDAGSFGWLDDFYTMAK
ncbi:MAG: hypothetical protein AB7S69_17170 [Salinivirgaceae bacterium]